MTPRRTILVNHLLEPPNRITGITRYLFALLPKLLTRNSFEYVLLTTWDPKKLPIAITNSTARVLTRRYYNSMPHNLLAQMAALPRLVRETGAVLEFNCNPVGCFWPTWPRVVTIHDLYFDVLPDKYPFRHRLWWHIFFPLTLSSCSHAICVSTNTQNDLLRFYPRLGRKGTVVLEASTLSTELKPAEQPNICVPCALYVGNMSPNKAPEVLVRGLEILESEGHSLNVYHVGRDESALLSEAINRSCLARPVQSIGQLSDSELAAAYAQATCLIVTSTNEGFCLPVLEAQSFGTPVICSDIPVLREVAGDGALFFRPGDPLGLARCLKTIFGNTEIRRSIGLAAQRNAERFSWTKAATEVEALFAKSCEERPAPWRGIN
jgi:glycosyltransferase involved in cell wall biosynthesis